MTKSICVLLLVAACGNQSNTGGGADDRDKITLATLSVKKYAFEAYPQWAMIHAEKQCPDKLVELNEWMNSKDAKDPWGNDYRMLCGPSLPAGAKGIAIVSNGPDGKPDTADDIKSY